jgi:hypothetical protein
MTGEPIKMGKPRNEDEIDKRRRSERCYKQIYLKFGY